MQCMKCGSVNSAESETCKNCGEVLNTGSEMETTIILSPIEVEEEYGEVEIKPESGPVLIVTKGPYPGQKFHLQRKEVTLGRDPGSDIFLDDITVSRHHAKIVLQGESVEVIDVGSLNGTYVNQQRIESSIALKPNDELQIGKYKMVFLDDK